MTNQVPSGACPTCGTKLDLDLLRQGVVHTCWDTGIAKASEAKCQKCGRDQTKEIAFDCYTGRCMQPQVQIAKTDFERTRNEVDERSKGKEPSKSPALREMEIAKATSPAIEEAAKYNPNTLCTCTHGSYSHSARGLKLISCQVIGCSCSKFTALEIEVDLCRRCNTMKHLNEYGLCGRCTDSPEAKATSEEAANGSGVATEQGNYTPMSFEDELIDQIVWLERLDSSPTPEEINAFANTLTAAHRRDIIQARIGELTWCRQQIRDLGVTKGADEIMRKLNELTKEGKDAK